MANKMMNINFDDGFKEISLNNDKNKVIRWNPTDVNFIDRFMRLQDWLENDFQKLVSESKIKNIDSDDYKEGEMIKLGEELSTMLDITFGSNISEIAFGKANPASPTSNGGLLFLNFIEALTPLIEDSISEYETANKKYVARVADHKKKGK